ncbi:unnamed protein product [Dibothriocephalus latus]|uniref:Uncharacterized protein n=1 Tax=Dibothriocephalus latus TaxID=60516 RepID=A0A3P7REK3_DIBLA|nr:unnamed protein product [Dibothriocephalus latus]
MAIPHIAESMEIVIPDAVLNTKLEEKSADNSTSSPHTLQIAYLSIRDISSIINARRRFIPVADTTAWKRMALLNTRRLLDLAFKRHAVVQCQRTASASKGSALSGTHDYNHTSVLKPNCLTCVG